MGIELTGCPECDKSLLKNKDLCTKHRLDMIGAQVSYWMRQWEETLEVYAKEIEELEKEIKEQNELSDSKPE